MSPFIKVTSKYCPNCNENTLSVLTNGNSNNPSYIKYICKNCNHEYTIDWSDIKNPRPLYLDYRVLKTLMSI